MNVPFPLNEPLPFHGVDNHRFKLGPNVFEAIEDPDDGYRSYLGSVQATDGEGIFFATPVDTVEVVEYEAGGQGWEHRDVGDVNGYALRSTSDGHIWLVFGTDNWEEYYPCFVFRYTPRAP